MRAAVFRPIPGTVESSVTSSPTNAAWSASGVNRERIEQPMRGPQRGAIERFHSQASDALNDGERVRLFATTVLTPLDRRAYQAVTTCARDIGALTALSPLGVLDGLIVLVGPGKPVLNTTIRLVFVIDPSTGDIVSASFLAG